MSQGVTNTMLHFYHAWLSYRGRGPDHMTPLIHTFMTIYIGSQRMDAWAQWWLLEFLMQMLYVQSACLLEQDSERSRALFWKLVALCSWGLFELSTFAGLELSNPPSRPQERRAWPPLWEARPLMKVELVCFPAVGSHTLNRYLDGLVDVVISTTRWLMPGSITAYQVQFWTLMAMTWIATFSTWSVSYFAFWFCGVYFLGLNLRTARSAMDFRSVVQHYALEIDGKFYELKRKKENRMINTIELQTDRVKGEKSELSRRCIGVTFFTHEEIEATGNDLIDTSPSYDVIQYNCQALAYNLALRILDDRGFPNPRLKKGYRNLHTSALVFVIYGLYFQLRMSAWQSSFAFPIARLILGAAVESHMLYYTMFWMFTYRNERPSLSTAVPQIVTTLIVTPAVEHVFWRTPQGLLHTLDRYRTISHVVLIMINVVSTIIFWLVHRSKYCDNTIVSDTVQVILDPERKDSIGLLIPEQQDPFDRRTGTRFKFLPPQTTLGVADRRRKLDMPRWLPLWHALGREQQTAILATKDEWKYCSRTPDPDLDVYHRGPVVMVLRNPPRAFTDGMWTSAEGWVQAWPPPTDELDERRARWWKLVELITIILTSGIPLAYNIFYNFPRLWGSADRDASV